LKKSLKKHFNPKKILHYIDMLKMSLLRGKILALDHYHSLGGKTKGQGQNFNIPQKKITLSSLLYDNYSNNE
jgi:hypothetical protein